MAAEPIEEDDSFNDPLPRAIKTVPRPTASKPPPHQPLKKPDSDPESDDSFDTFLPTQTTGGASTKSSAGSTQPNEHKPPAPTIPPPFRLQPPPTVKPPFSLSTQASGGFTQHQNSFKPTNAPFIHTQANRTEAPRKGPPPSFHPLCAVPPQQSQVPILRRPETSAIGKEAIGQNSEITNAINREMSQLSTSSEPFSASPNSLSRHRSVNSCLRNNPLNASSVRTGSILHPRTTPLFDTGRPGALRGDVIMLRDQLENEKRKVLRLQADFQRDFLKKEEEHHRLLAKRDEIIEKHRKEIEVLKSAIACKTPENTAKFAPRVCIAPCFPAQMAPSPPSTSITRLATASSSADVKKRYPKIPAEQRLKTPQRNATASHQVSVFRHSLKESEDDTFQLDASFEPSATSTPKFSGNKRIGLRRPLSLAEDGLDENFCGAPAAKRKPFFMEERRRRTREELNEKIKEIWNNIDRDSANTLPDISTSTKGKSERMDTKDNYDGEWMDRHLSRRMKHLMVRKSESKKKRKREKITNRARQKLLRQADSKPAPPKCAVCLLDPMIMSRDFLKSSERTTTSQPAQKEWEAQENQKVELLKKRAEEKRVQYYSMLVSSICQNGIYEVEGMAKRKEQAEREHRQRIAEFKPRGLEELREEKREQWRTDVMSELSEKGEMYAGMELKDGGRKEDYIWTEDEDDEDWMFPIPYNHPRSNLCAGCARLQKRQRRIVKREREMQKIRSDCLQEYAMEQRELLRNTSILTKSRIERARICLYRENDISTDSFDESAIPNGGGDENSL